MIRTKDDQSLPRRGQLGRFRKVSNSRESTTTTTVLDFFGIKKEKTDVHGIPEWENPVEAGRSHQTTQEKVSPRKPQRFGSPRAVGRHKSAPVYKQTAAASLSSKSPGTHKTPHSDPSRYVTQSLENMVIECRPGQEENLGASLGDITLDGIMADFETTNHRPSFQHQEQQQEQQQPPALPRHAIENNPSIRISSHGASVERVRSAQANDLLRPPSAFGPRRKTPISIDRPPASPSKQSSSALAATREEEEEERSLHDKIGSSPSTESYQSDCGNSLASSNNAINLASAGCHLSMIAASPRAVQRSTSSEAGADPVAWRKEGKRWLKLDPHPNNDNNRNSSRGGENDNHHALQEDYNAESRNRRHHNHQHRNDFIAKAPRRSASLDTDVATRRLRELEEEKQMLEQAMMGRMEKQEQQQLVTGAASVVSHSAPSLDGLDGENGDNILKREEALIAEALKRSMQEM